MASKAQKTIFDEFQAASGAPSGDTANIVESEYGIASSLQEALTELAGLKQENTSPASVSPGDILTGVMQGAPPSSISAGTSPRSGSGVADTFLSVASKVFESGLGIVPLVSGLMGLFGGGQSTPPPLVRYAMPEHLYFTGADTGGAMSEADYDQFGAARLYDGSQGAAGSGRSAVQPAGTPAPATSGGLQNTAPPQINVTVQAMDSQSFLDHSTEIAQAVRQAMLSLSSINDVVNDLS